MATRSRPLFTKQGPILLSGMDLKLLEAIETNNLEFVRSNISAFSDQACQVKKYINILFVC